MKKFCFYLLIAFATQVADGAEYRFFDLVVERDFPEAEGEELAEEIIRSIGNAGVTLKSFAIVRTDSDGRTEYDRTFTLRIPKIYATEERETPAFEAKVGLQISIEETEPLTSISYKWSEVDRWVPITETSFVPKIQHFDINISRDFSGRRFVSTGRLEGEGPHRILVVERAGGPGEGRNGGHSGADEYFR